MSPRARLAASSSLAIVVLCLPVLAAGPARDLESDTWVATDALGRTLPGRAECGAPRAGRVVGIFYFLWLGQHGTRGPFDITEITKAAPGARRWGPPGTFHHWGKPELGYYLSTDEWVIRRHATLLNAAGVDVLFFDATNGSTYPESYLALCRVYRQMRAEGNRTPQFAFLTNSGHVAVVERLYRHLYEPGRFRELWFHWQGKPLILSKTEGLPPEILEFFTFRRSWAWSATEWFGDGRDRWPWLDHYPQKPGWHEEGKPEQVPVAVAQHPVTNIGRSFHDGRQPPPGERRTDEGLCFAEQWRRALEVDPEVVFVTGWNEWVAQRFIAEGPRAFVGGRIPRGGTYFVDQYDREYSRDIEPMAGGHGDDYYYQLVANARRFKGVRAPRPPSAPHPIAIDGDASDWRDVEAVYFDAIGDTAWRDHPGWGSAGRYVDRTGRNDIVECRVAHDAVNVYFSATTRQPLTRHSDPRWMLLFINADRDHGTGWEGYDFVINREFAGEGKTAVCRLRPDGTWRRVAAGPWRVAPPREGAGGLELAVPRAALGSASGAAVELDFHWADNPQADGDITEFGRHGDSAPERRFDYRYRGRP